MSSRSGILRALAPILCATLLGSTAAFGQAASDVRCNKCVDAGDIAKGAIDKKRLAKGAVVRRRIAKGAVNAARLAGGAVTEAKIGDGAVTGAKIRGGVVSAGKIAPLAVTGDKIAPLAVTGPKLAPGAATADKIAVGAITGAKLEDDAVDSEALAAEAVTTNALADGTVETSDLANGAVGSLEIAAGAGTADALAGSITGPKFAAASVTADKLVPGLGGLRFARTIVISPTGTPAENCTALRNVLFGITDNAADNRYVVKLEPGVYDCGSIWVTMKSFVDIEGSGEQTTLIQGSIPHPNGVVNGSDDSELRALTVVNDNDNMGIGTVAIAGSNSNVRLSRVTAHAENDLGSAFGIFLTGPAMLSDVTASAFSLSTFAAGIQVDADGVQLVRAKGTGGGTSSVGFGLHIQSAVTATARDSVFTGDTDAVAVAVTNGSVNLVSSQLNGGRSAVGSFNCVGAYDAGFGALDGNCN